MLALVTTALMLTSEPSSSVQQQLDALREQVAIQAAQLERQAAQLHELASAPHRAGEHATPSGRRLQNAAASSAKLRLRGDSPAIFFGSNQEVQLSANDTTLAVDAASAIFQGSIHASSITTASGDLLARAQVLEIISAYHMSIATCETGTYWSSIDASCSDCHESCKVCLGAGDGDCLQCYDDRGATIAAGRCSSPPPPLAPPPSPPSLPPPLTPPPSSPALESCNAYKQGDPSATSGSYTIRLPDGSTTDVQCYMTADHGYTRLVGPGIAAYSDPGWLSTADGNTFSNPDGPSGHKTGAFTAAWLRMTTFSHVAFMHYTEDNTDSMSAMLEYDVSSCRDPTHSASEWLRQASTGASSTCGSLTLNAATIHNSCGLQARFSYHFHTWDGGVSGSYYGWGQNGYKTNNPTNCGSECVTNCVLNNGKQAGQKADSLWVR